MANKIKMIIVEPTKVVVGSTFKLVIKADKGLTFDEIEDNYETIELIPQNLTLEELGGSDKI